MADVRLIDANALMEQVSKKTIKVAQLRYTEGFNEAIMKVRSMIHSAPTISAVPVVHGRWVHDDLGHTYCSRCHERLPYIHCYSDEPCSDFDEEWDEEMPESRYCPNCGAKMDAKDMDVPTKDGGASDGSD